MPNDKIKYKGIEKYIDTSKLDIEELPDIEDDDIGKILHVNKDGEPEWISLGFDGSDINDLIVKLEAYDGKIEATVSKVEKLETSTTSTLKEIIAGLEIEKNRVNLMVSKLEKLVTSNKDLFDKFVSDNQQIVADIYQVIERNSSTIDILSKQIDMMVEESSIKGAYIAGSNDIPTDTWHNQVNPLNNANLVNFLFEQDSGWIGKSTKDHKLMFSGNQTLTIKNPLKVDEEYTTFTVDVWFRPYDKSESSLMDFIYLYDTNEEVRFKSPNIDIRTNISLEPNTLHHLAFSINIQDKIFNLYIDGEKVELLKTVNSSSIDIPNIITLFQGFKGEVYSFKMYKKPMSEKQILRNFKEGHLGQGYVMFFLEICLEAMKAEAVFNETTRLESSISILNEAIKLSVSKEEYEKHYDDVIKRLNEAELKIEPDAITSTVIKSEEFNGVVNQVQSQITQNADKIDQTIKDNNENFSNIKQELGNISLNVLQTNASLQGLDLGKQNKIRNSGEYPDTKFWSDNCELIDGVLQIIGVAENSTPIPIDKKTTYMYSATMKSTAEIQNTGNIPLTYVVTKLASSKDVPVKNPSTGEIRNKRVYSFSRVNEPTVITCSGDIFCSPTLLVGSSGDPAPPEDTLPIFEVNSDRYFISRNQSLEVSFQTSRPISKVDFSLDNGRNFTKEGTIKDSTVTIDTTDLNSAIYTCRLKCAFEDGVEAMSKAFSLIVEDVVVEDEVFEKIEVITHDKIHNTDWVRVAIKLTTKKNLGVGYSITPKVDTGVPANKWWLKNIQFKKGTILTDWELAIEDRKDIILEESRAELKVEADKIMSTVKKKVGKDTFDSALEQTAEEIKARVTYADFEAQIKITAQEINSKVSNSTYQSEISQLADSINSKVSSGDIESLIKQNADSWKLSINGKLNSVYYNFDENGFTLGGSNNGNTVEHTKEYSKWKHQDGTFAMADYTGFYHGGENISRRPFCYINYMVHRPKIKNGETITIVLPKEFQGKVKDRDFTVFATHGDIDSDANARWKIDAIRTIFVKVTSWNPGNRELQVKPCLQKIGLKTLTYFGWDASTTTPGNTIGEGNVDVIVEVSM